MLFVCLYLAAGYDIRLSRYLYRILLVGDISLAIYGSGRMLGEEQLRELRSYIYKAYKQFIEI